MNNQFQRFFLIIAFVMIAFGMVSLVIHISKPLLFPHRLYFIWSDVIQIVLMIIVAIVLIKKGK